MSAEPVFRDYLGKIERDLRAGNATEHTYRPYLKDLLESLAPGTVATNEPKRVQCGAPDYVVSTRTAVGPATIGYVEAKDVGISLSEIARTEQVRRYRDALDNLVLTNYLDFQWYVDGQERMAARLATLRQGYLIVDHAATEEAEQLLRSFVGRSPELIRSPRVLAVRMAHLTHMIRDIVANAFSADAVSKDLKGLYSAFQKVLIPDLSVPNFADMFAQTLAYGLFAARVRHTGPTVFTRAHAAAEIPRTNPLLRRLFATIAGPDLDAEPYAGFVDDLTELLAHADMPTILADFGKRTRQQDPVVHFYETFLQAYDPKLRELRGVYYTPEPVVSYIVRSVDALLKRDFDCTDGLGDTATVVHQRVRGDGQREAVRMPRVLILDPACGTGTFLYNVVDTIRERFMRSGNAGMWSGYVREQLMPRLFGFELLMAPYAMAHLKLGMQLGAMDLPESQRQEWAYDFASGERLGVFLTNSLEEAAKKVERLPLGEYISDEANEAANIKRDDPVMVVLGNPPYSGHSANKGLWITSLLHGLDTMTGAHTTDYFEVDGEPLGERNAAWLYDDYVKFIRFAQWRIARTGHGIVALITNNGYLDNPTFRGMRQSLLEAFDDIYILNLHGDSKKKERAPDGGPDENVFDIQQGVAIGVFVKRKETTERPRVVNYAELFGMRNGPSGKYEWLLEHDVGATAWVTWTPERPFYLFVPRNPQYDSEFQQGCSVTDLLPLHGWGVKTRKDYLLVDFDRAVLEARFRDIANLSAQEAIAKYDIKESPYWNLATAKQQMSKDIESNVQPILFRPFDKRYVYYDKCMIERGDHRYDLMRNMFQQNRCLITVRRTEVADIPNHFFCTDDLSVVHSTSAKEVNFVFPLYLYPDLSKPVLMHDEPLPDAPGHRRPNLAPAFISDFAARLRMTWVPDGKGDRVRTFGPEDVFSYIYAVFHSPTYRERYAEFLKTDFPRLPLTRHPDLFRELCGLGDELVGLHLMERKATPITRYPVPGSNLVERVHYTGPEEGADVGRVWINGTQYFEGVPPDVWEFHIGGYQVCEKWLKDRRGRTLSYDDLAHYEQIVAALSETIRLMGAIDETIEDHGGWPLDQQSAGGEGEPAQVLPSQ